MPGRWEGSSCVSVRVAPGQQEWYKNRGRVEIDSGGRHPRGENEAMPDVRVILREGQEKRYHEATASIHSPDRTLRITRNQDSIAEFQSEYYQYWEYGRGQQRGHRRGHANRSVGERVSGKRAERRSEAARWWALLVQTENSRGAKC